MPTDRRRQARDARHGKGRNAQAAAAHVLDTAGAGAGVGAGEAGADGAEPASPVTCSGWLHVTIICGRDMPNLDFLKKMDPYVVMWVEPIRSYGLDHVSKGVKNKVRSLVDLPCRKPRGCWKPTRDRPNKPRNYDRTSTLFNKGGNPDWDEKKGDTCKLRVWVEDSATEVQLVVATVLLYLEGSRDHSHGCIHAPLIAGLVSGSLGRRQVHS